MTTIDARDAWDAVAADGTDPELLAAVVSRAAADPRGFATQWQQARKRGASGATAVRDMGAAPVVVAEPGRDCGQRWLDRGVRVALAGDPGMPPRLEAVEAAPPWLASRARGKVDARVKDATPAVAIVGSRKASAYGRGMAAWLAESVGAAGIRVVSGGAVGIDAAAHEAATATAGGTTVVLGCGHAVDYPRPHAGPGALFERIRDAGGVILSESLASEPPRPWRVRSRNRLIAALADAVVVVEGGARSGALITANWAADYGIPVLAVPGDARAPGSAAGLQLLREGAGLCAEPADLLAVVGTTTVPDGPPVAGPASTADAAGPSHAEDGRVPGLPDEVGTLLVHAWPRPLSLGQLAAESGMPIGTLMAAVTSAQVAGVLTRDVDGLRLRRGPST